MDSSIEIISPPDDLIEIYETIFSEDLKEFVVKICRQFDSKIDRIFVERLKRRILLEEREFNEVDESLESLADFVAKKFTGENVESDWKIGELPKRLRNRHLDLGDVSPSDTHRFEACLKMDSEKVQGIQVDFDDGHCPTWRNQLIGWYNIYNAVHQQQHRQQQQQQLSLCPILMLRPRAWNMTDSAVMVDGKRVSGALLDFAILIFHNGKLMANSGSCFNDRIGPFFYLSKLESSGEARLWAEIFTWSEQELGLEHGSIKACVLIENILASFDMENILHEIRDFAIGLNCGIWDYSASIINKFGKRKNFILPDRKKYVNMEREFLKNYMRKVIRVCHSRGALATGGMAAQLLSKTEDNSNLIEGVCQAKRKEIRTGADGFLVYDLDLVEPLFQLWSQDQQIELECDEQVITGSSLLKIPTGGATLEGLEHNIAVGILFIQSWISDGKGCFEFKGFVEDSATAEISRSQVWQWIRHGVRLENDGRKITLPLVAVLVKGFVERHTECSEAAKIFLEIVGARDYPEFITTYLSLEHEFLKSQF